MAMVSKKRLSRNRRTEGTTRAFLALMRARLLPLVSGRFRAAGASSS